MAQPAAHPSHRRKRSHHIHVVLTNWFVKPVWAALIALTRHVRPRRISLLAHEIRVYPRCSLTLSSRTFSSLKRGYTNSVDWSGWTGLLEWTTGLEHWSTGTLEPSSVTAGYSLYPCITRLRRTLDSVSTWQNHGEVAVSESLPFWAWPITLCLLNAGTSTLSQCWYNHAE